jgi:hypothetical protein
MGIPSYFSYVLKNHKIIKKMRDDGIDFRNFEGDKPL